MASVGRDGPSTARLVDKSKTEQPGRKPWRTGHVLHKKHLPSPGCGRRRYFPDRRDSAQAHDAPKGWTYPYSCCSGYDCREVASKAISERPDGYVIRGTGEVVSYHDKRLRTSPDGEFHWCSVAGANDGRTICLFVPPRSY